jgi:hypothetical protein
MNNVDVGTLLPLLIPVLLIEIALWVVSFIDLSKRDKVRGGSKVLWVVIILLLNLIGPILYLVWGRNVDSKEENANGSGDKD